MREQRTDLAVLGLLSAAFLCVDWGDRLAIVSRAEAQAPDPAQVAAPAAGQGRTFRLDLGSSGNGSYTVIVHVADRRDRTGFHVTAEGQPVTPKENINPVTGKLDSLQFNVTIADGALDLTVADSLDDVARTVTRVEFAPANAQNPIRLTAPMGLGHGRLALISSEPLGQPEGTLITVKPSAGTIRTPDAAPRVAGHQIAVARGVITFLVEMPAQVPIIVDNADPAFSTAGNWTPQQGQGFRNSQSLSPPGSGGKPATWTVANLTPSATYLVSATWTPQSKQATRAAYEVRYPLPGGQAERIIAHVNQTLPPADFVDRRVAWTTLAMVIPAGNTLTVQLSDLGDGPVVADAIRVQQISGPAGDLQIATADAQGQARGVSVFPLNHASEALSFDLESSRTAPEGYTGVFGGSVYDPSLGFGWLAPARTFDRSMVSSDWLLRDGHYDSTDQIFRVQLDPRQDYQITLRFWDTFHRDGIQVSVGDAPFPHAEVGCLPPEIAVAQTFTVSGASLSRWGWLDLRFHDTWSAGGGGDPFWIINAIEIIRLPRRPPEEAVVAPPPVQPLPAPAFKP